ncbi:hypothetical protein F4805DRAFT_470201 [Annulohypoxylon moriforme]|nr:hypothetical protein F4805DRAFT_470201 [Annulohypoxylon moriforme]
MSARANSSYTPPMLRCQKCQATFPSGGLLRSHQHQAGHLMCSSCEASFHTVEALLTHRKNDHRAAQDLTCPGCTRNFTSAGRWIHHVESGQCSSIFPSDISHGVTVVMDTIAKRLIRAELQSESNIDFSSPSHITDVWGAEWANSQSLDAQKNPENFPTIPRESPHGDSKQSDLLAGTSAGNLKQQPGNVWAQKKDLFPEKTKEPVVTTTPQAPFLESLEEPTPLSRPTGQRILDPNHEDFNVAVFWNPILEVYKCPHRSCKSKFQRSNGLVAHLNSSAHSGVRFNCPGCKGMYTSAFAWVQHVESVSLSKCRLRESHEIYGYALKEITNGALEVDTLTDLPDAAAKVKVVEDWAKTTVNPKNNFVPGTNEYTNAKQAEAYKKRA